MIALCRHENFKKSGKNRNGTQRFKCKDCGVRFSDEQVHDGPFGSMRIEPAKAELVLKMLLEGMSIRAAERLTGVSRSTIDRLILVAGEKCQTFLDYNIINVSLDDLQIDEIWSFVGKKARKVTGDDEPVIGDSWTYICVDRETKLIAAHYVGKRDMTDTSRFLQRVRKAVNTSQSFQLSSDGWGAYKYGVPFSLGSNVNFGQLIKKYSSSQETTRYSPAQIISAEKKARFGSPDPEKICTSHVESLNQTIRMQLRRFTRLTNGHSKSLEHHVAMQAIFVAHYNFCRVHSSLDKQTPAMAAGLTERQLELLELLGK